MKYRVVLQRPECAIDGFGAEYAGATKFSDYRTVSAERVKVNPSAVIDAAERFADYRAEFNIRDAHPVAEGWRLRQLGGHLYTITNIIHNLDRGMLTLSCERVNE